MTLSAFWNALRSRVGIVIATVAVAGSALAAVFTTHPVIGTGAAQPTAKWYPPQTDFGFVEVGQTVDRTIRLKNVGRSGNLVGSVTMSSGCVGFTIVSGGGSYSLPPMQSKNVTIRFAPTDTTTAYSCDVRSGP